MNTCIHGPRQARQQGMVLITAVLIVAVIATVAAALGLGQQVWLRQTENLNERAQGDSLRHSALNWIGLLLARDARDNKIDHLGEPWASQIPPLPAEGGMISVALRDAQGLFNLNNLVQDDGAPSAPDIGIFQRLLQAQGLDPALIEPLIDWMDPDSNARAGGAEDADYLSLQPGYRAANQRLTSVDELRLIKGFTPSVVEKLRPLVTVLPVRTEINVNTVIEPVLIAMFASSPGPLSKTILQQRVTQPFKDVAQFRQMVPAGLPAPQAAYGVTTGHFLVTIGIRTGRLNQQSEALIARPADRPATVLWQRLNPVLPKPATENDG